MKSVFMTFSQNVGNLASKLCLAILCVFVFSSVGNAQSFKNLDESRQTIVNAVLSVDGKLQSSTFDGSPMVIKTENTQGQAVTASIEPSQIDGAQNPDVTRHYLRSLLGYLGTAEKPNVISVAIQENHDRMLSTYSGETNYLEALKQEVIELLSI